jgi:hypothetical protein
MRQQRLKKGLVQPQNWAKTPTGSFRLFGTNRDESKQRQNPDVNPERFLSSLIVAILGPVLFAVVVTALMAGWLIWAAVSLAVLVFVAWKGPDFLRRGIYVLRAKSPEPLYSCLVPGIAATLSVGVFMSVPILLLGHTRPEGWDFDRIPRWMAIAFVAGLVYGVPSGMKRKRERTSQSATGVP